MNQPWPFDQAENVAALTTKQVVKENKPILSVVHYSDDHSWAFTCGTTNESDHLMVVGLGCLLALDATLTEIADLLPGWGADRAAVGAKWHRYESNDF